MPAFLIPRETVARRLGVTPELLVRYERRGLVRVVREGDVVGYEPSELPRIWSVVSLHRDAGINLAGVECILRMRAHVETMHRHLRELAVELRTLLDEADAESAP